MRSSGTQRQRERVLEAAQTCLDDALHLLAAVDDLAAGGEIGYGHVLEQVAAGVLEEVHGGTADLVEVEAADVGGHGHADALVGRHQDVGERGGQQARLLHGAVVAVHEVDRVLVDVLEDLGTDGGELGLGVTRGGVGQVARVVLAESCPWTPRTARAAPRCPWRGGPSSRRWRRRRAG